VKAWLLIVVLAIVVLAIAVLVITDKLCLNGFLNNV